VLLAHHCSFGSKDRIAVVRRVLQRIPEQRITFTESCRTEPFNTPVTKFDVRFNWVYQPGTFRAYLDENEITQSFSPAGVPGGAASALWNEPYQGGYDEQGVYIGVPQWAGVSFARSTTGSGLYHKLRVTGSCLLYTICIGHDEYTFTPIHYVGVPEPLQVPVGTAITMTLRADRSLPAPLFVSVQPILLGSFEQPAGHVQVDRAPPGQAASVMLPAGTTPALVRVAGLQRGGFWLKISAPGTQIGGVDGRVD
jgi:hypothetical protein